MINNKEEYIKSYNSAKEEILLPDDIALMRKIQEEVSRFPSLTSAEELIDLESNLTELSYRLAGLIGRLSSQYEIRGKEIKEEMYQYAKKLLAEGKEKSMTRAEVVAESDFYQKRIELEIFGGIVDEYKGKSYALKDIFLAVTHRIHRFSK